VPNRLSVIIPFSSATAAAATALERAIGRSAQVLLAGDEGKGNALRAALPRVTGEVVILQDADEAYSTATYPALTAPLFAGEADAVFGAREASLRSLPDRALSSVSRLLVDGSLRDPLSGQRAFRTEALRSLGLTAHGDDVDAELLVKLAAREFRLAEVDIAVAPGQVPPLAGLFAQAKTLLRYATTSDDADNLHEGYTTLARMESGAPNYNRVVGRLLAAHCGARILEVGAGIGTITAQLEAGRELVVALEVDPFYIERLKRRFRDKPHVRPTFTDVADTDWERLREDRIDTVVLSNVLEHIEDDAGAVAGFKRLLPPGGRVVILVPAMPALFGAMDEAVGHFRRYSREGLRALLEGDGFQVEQLDFMNLVSIPGWFMNGRVFRRRSVPPLQLRLYDRVHPLIEKAEGLLPRLPVGMNLFAVARVP
jgi:SAM-dependent methyltransferase